MNFTISILAFCYELNPNAMRYTFFENNVSLMEMRPIEMYFVRTISNKPNLSNSTRTCMNQKSSLFSGKCGVICSLIEIKSKLFFVAYASSQRQGFASSSAPQTLDNFS